MLRHGIRSREVDEALAHGERIEEYPDDTPLPSYLVLGFAGQRPLHVVAADDVERSETIVITTYQPDPNEWETDLKTRRQR